jgi:hypothetical protein
MTNYHHTDHEPSTKTGNAKMDKPITDDEIDRFLAEEVEWMRHRDAGTLLSLNMTSYLGEKFNADTSPAARALLDAAEIFEFAVRENAMAWQSTGIAASLAVTIVSAAEDQARLVDAGTCAFLRAFTARGAAGMTDPGAVIAELLITAPDTQASHDQHLAAACFKAWTQADVQLEQLEKRYSNVKPKASPTIH